MASAIAFLTSSDQISSVITFAEIECERSTGTLTHVQDTLAQEVKDLTTFVLKFHLFGSVKVVAKPPICGIRLKAIWCWSLLSYSLHLVPVSSRDNSVGPALSLTA